ncbi:hypothetical protein Patl1_21620 [Pistacia atlantica]|uniref:Uncharacterized protein n=1 Tax=Pistacia atlantica TaxID=434234 RepID=A0ACC1BMQ8_9ROSI|nr:hypothetical protein Patl1_21620 [Pistacia atlantica]
MDPNLFDAAAEGNIEPFKELKAQHVELQHFVTQILKDTILHINIKSQKKDMESTEFMTQILEMCPSLLLQVNAEGDAPLHVAANRGRSTMVQLLIQHAKTEEEEKDLESGLKPEWEMLKMTNYENNTALHEAVRHESQDSVYVVEILTEEGDPDFHHSANNLGETPLYLAAARGHDRMVIQILERCTTAAHEGPNGKTALHEAAIMCYPGAVEKILEKKKSLTKVTDQHGWTPFHYAAYYRWASPRVVKLLLKRDRSTAYSGDKDRRMTPLHMAASQGNLEAINSIISNCPECYELEDDRGWNVLHFAMLSLNEEPLKHLLERSLIRSLINKKDAKEYSTHGNRGKNGSSQHFLYMDPNLFDAAAEGNIEPFKELKAQHVELQHFVTQILKDTILHINIKFQKVSTEFVTQILEMCPSLLLQVNAEGDAPLHVAAKRGRSTIVKLLIQHAKTEEEIDLESGLKRVWEMLKMTNYENNTALHKSVRHDSFDVVKILTEEGDPDFHYSANNFGETPLYLAASRANDNMVIQILERCTTAAHEGPNGKTALHAAAIVCQPECHELEDDRGWNVLHFAMLSLNKEDLKHLLESSLIMSLINKKDAKGNTPLHIWAAARRGLFYFHGEFGDWKAVNNQNVGVFDIEQYGYSELEKEIQELSKDVGKGNQYPNGVIRNRKDTKIEDESAEDEKETRASHLVVATLIATVTFAAAFTFPGGYNSEKGQNQGTAILGRNSAFQAFIITNTIAMTLSLSAVFIHLFLALKFIIKPWENRRLLVIALNLTMFAMGAMVIAFITGTYAVLAPSLGLAITTCFIGLIFFLLAFFVLRFIVTSANEDID